MSKLKSWNQTKGDRKSEIKNQNTLDLDNIRNEIQRIIDNHLKNKAERFSVENWKSESLRILIDLLLGYITRKEIKERQKRKEKEIKKIYEEILNIQDSVNALISTSKGTGTDLLQFKEDISLGNELSRL